LRVSQDFSEGLTAKKRLMAVAIRKPHRQEYVQVRPGEEHWVEVCLLKVREENDEIYAVVPSLARELPGEIQRCALFTTITDRGFFSSGTSNFLLRAAFRIAGIPLRCRPFNLQGWVDQDSLESGR